MVGLASFIVALATAAYAAQDAPLTVTINLNNKLDSTGSACNVPPAFSCTSASNSCCADGNTYFAAVFVGLPTEPTNGVGVGAVYNNGNCGTNCNTGSGENVCIGCKVGGSIFAVKSANWYLLAPSKRGANTPAAPTECKKPDLAHIDGHQFDINYDVPKNVTDALVELAIMGNMTYDQVPKELLQYETDRYRNLLDSI